MNDPKFAQPVGDLTVQIQAGQIVGPSGSVTLEPKVAELLRALLRQPNHIHSRQDLIDTLWSPHQGGDESLSRAVSRLRKALEAAGSQLVGVDTFPKRGYQLRVHTKTEVQPTRQGLRRVAIAAGAALVVVLGCALWWQSRQISTPAVLVLPFSASTPNFYQYLAYGLNDQTVQQLRQAPRLKLIRWPHNAPPLPSQTALIDQAKQLQATHIVTADVWVDGEQIRVDANLIGTNDSSESSLPTVFGTFSELPSIALQLSQSILDQLKQPRTNATLPKASGDAQDMFLRGKFARQMLRLEGDDGAITLLRSAIQLQPDWVAARAELASALQALALFTPPQSPLAEPRRQNAVDMAESVLAVDPNNTSAIQTLAAIEMIRGRWRAGQALADRAAAMQAANRSDSSAPPHDLRIAIAQTTGRVQQAIRTAQSVLRDDPTNIFAHSSIAYSALQLKDCSLVERHGRQALLLGDSPARGGFGLIFCLAANNQADAALDLMREFNSIGGGDYFPSEGFTPLLMQINDNSARSVFTEWAMRQPFPMKYFEILHFIEAFEALDDLLRQQFQGPASLTSPYDWRFLLAPGPSQFRQSETFVELLKASGLPDYWRQYGWPDICRDDTTVCQSP